LVKKLDFFYTIIREIIDKESAPAVEAISSILNGDREDVFKGLGDLQEYLGVVLLSNEPKHSK
jgi:hypothetical protein